MRGKIPDDVGGITMVMPYGSHPDAMQERARTLVFLKMLVGGWPPELEAAFAIAEAAGAGLTVGQRSDAILETVIAMIAAGQANDIMETLRGEGSA